MTRLNGLQKRVDQLQPGQPLKLEVVEKVGQVGRPVATVLLWAGQPVKVLAPGLWDKI